MDHAQDLLAPGGFEIREERGFHPCSHSMTMVGAMGKRPQSKSYTVKPPVGGDPGGTAQRKRRIPLAEAVAATC
jgi:hypothetical protein